MSSPTKNAGPGMSWYAEPHMRRKPWNPGTEKPGEGKGAFPECPISQQLSTGHTTVPTFKTIGSQPFRISFPPNESNSSQPGRVPWLSASLLNQWGGFELKFYDVAIIPIFLLYQLSDTCAFGLLKKCTGLPKAAMNEAGIKHIGSPAS